MSAESTTTAPDLTAVEFDWTERKASGVPEGQRYRVLMSDDGGDTLRRFVDVATPSIADAIKLGAAYGSGKIDLAAAREIVKKWDAEREARKAATEKRERDAKK